MELTDDQYKYHYKKYSYEEDFLLQYNEKLLFCFPETCNLEGS